MTLRSSAQTLPDPTELREKGRNPPEHKLLRVLQGLVIIGAPEEFDPPISAGTRKTFCRDAVPFPFRFRATRRGSCRYLRHA